MRSIGRETIIANFIIGGTEKSGTTSVFNYMLAHPEVCGASTKETDFFRREIGEDLTQARRDYSEFFSHCPVHIPVVMEASPGYLGEASGVAPGIRAVAPSARFLFILRDPVARMLSSYTFHVNQLNIDPQIGFPQYVDECRRYDSGELDSSDSALDDWYLKVLQFGRYADGLRVYFDQFPAEQILVTFYDDLLNDSQQFMRRVSHFLQIDSSFWENYEFVRSNVTFSGKNRTLHRLALRLNALAEPVLLRHPGVKRRLLGIYKWLNQAREGYSDMDASVHTELADYYRESVERLESLLGTKVPATWLQR